MDKTENYLTQAIVGKRQRLVLGTQVRYEGEALLALPQSSRLAVALQDAGAFLAGHWRTWVTGASVAAFVAGSAAGITWLFMQKEQSERASAPVAEAVTAPSPSSLPIAPAPESPAPVTAITVAAEPFQVEEVASAEPAAATGTASLGLQAPEGPLPVGQAVSALSMPARPLPSAPVNQPPIKIGQPSPVANAKNDVAGNKKGEKEREDAPRAMVLDASKEPSEKPTAPGSQTLSVATAPASKTGKVVMPTEIAAPGAGPTGQSAAATRPTIVTIAEDNSYVLITNPSTRLPQKFQVGQKLPTGATVQKIDHAKGVVQIDGQTFGLQ